MLINITRFQSWEEAGQRPRPMSVWYWNLGCSQTLKITHEFHPVARGWRDVPGALPPAWVFVRPVGAHQGPLCAADLVYTAGWGQAERESERERGSSLVGSRRGVLEESPPWALVTWSLNMGAEAGLNQGFPGSEICWCIFLCYLPGVSFLTIAICFAVVIGNMVELVKTTGPGVRWASFQVLVPLHTSWGTLGTSVSLGVLVCKRSANLWRGVSAWIKWDNPCERRSEC